MIVSSKVLLVDRQILDNGTSQNIDAVFNILSRDLVTYNCSTICVMHYRYKQIYAFAYRTAALCSHDYLFM